MGSREKWLYFSYTPASDKCSRIIRRLEGHDQAVEMPLSQSRTRDRTRSARRRGTGASGRPRCGREQRFPILPELPVGESVFSPLTDSTRSKARP